MELEFISLEQAEELVERTCKELLARGSTLWTFPIVELDLTGRVNALGWGVGGTYRARGICGPTITIGRVCFATTVIHELAHHLHYENDLQLDEDFDEDGELVPRKRKTGVHHHDKRFFEYLLRCIKASGVEYDWECEYPIIRKRAIKAGLYTEPTWEEIDEESARVDVELDEMPKGGSTAEAA